jgi:hypothetical protein
LIGISLVALCLRGQTPPVASAAGAGNRSLFIVFGPAGADGGSPAGHSYAVSAQQWLQSSGATLEVRRPGVSVGQAWTRNMQLADLERSLLDAARAGRASKALDFLNALDKATYALARQVGKRLLVVAVEGRSLAAPDAMQGGPEEVENRLSQTLDFCKTNSVAVIVLDPDPAAKEALPALASLAAGTGGVLIRDPNALGTNALALAPAEKAAESPAARSEPATAAVFTVHLRLIRTLPGRTRSGSDMGPMSGLFLVESPFRNLEFQTDDRAGTYQARARVTEVIRGSDGKAAWQAQKEVTIKGPLRGLPARREGNLYYMRQVQLPPGQYAFEATVEDLVSGKSATAREAQQAHDTVPGFDVSDAMFVRKLNDATDKFEADQVLSYDGKAFAPMLAPVFRADQPVDLQLYAILYPDFRGGTPDMRLEILRAGQVVGRSQLHFGDQIRNTSTEGSMLDAKGEQKHEFPYIATIVGASFEPGDYVAQLIVRQGGKTLTRATPFRVTEAR